MLGPERQQNLIGRRSDSPARQHAPNQLVDQKSRIAARSVLGPTLDSSDFQRLPAALAPVGERKQRWIELPEHKRIAKLLPAGGTIQPTVRIDRMRGSRAPVRRIRRAVPRDRREIGAANRAAYVIAVTRTRLEISIRDQTVVHEHRRVARYPRERRQFSSGRQAQAFRQASIEHRVHKCGSAIAPEAVLRFDQALAEADATSIRVLSCALTPPAGTMN